MADVTIHRADELAPATKAAVEAELGRPLQSHEKVSIMAFSRHEAPRGKVQQLAAAGLRDHFRRLDRKTETVPSNEMESFLAKLFLTSGPAIANESESCT
jgi:hypothetical protein